MAWPSLVTDSFLPNAAYINSIVNSLSQWGGNVNGGGHTLSNVVVSANSLAVTGAAAFSSSVSVKGAAGTQRALYMATGSVTRWNLYASDEAESGANAGSNLCIGRYNNAGVWIGTPLGINRTTGLVTLTGTFGAPASAPGVARFGQSAGLGCVDVRFGDTHGGSGWLQSRLSGGAGTAYPLLLNPLGGAVVAGTGVYTGPLWIGAMRLWVDTTAGRLRYKYNADPVSMTDGTLI